MRAAILLAIAAIALIASAFNADALITAWIAAYGSETGRHIIATVCWLGGIGLALTALVAIGRVAERRIERDFPAYGETTGAARASGTEGEEECSR